MNDYVNYLVEANLGIILFLGFYLLLFRNETSFTKVRLVLLSGLIICVLFPLLRINTQGIALPKIHDLFPTVLLPELSITTSKDSGAYSTGTDYFSILKTVYFAGFIASLLLFLATVIRLTIAIVRSEPVKRDKYWVAESNHNTASFSFFHFIFIGQCGHLTSSEKQQVIEHESVHADQLHSFDILLIHIVQIFFWFNPLLGVYKNIFIQLHEFEADARSVKDERVNDYCNLLARVALLSADLRIANHFSNSLTLKRIQMMRRNKMTIPSWKMALFATAIPGFFFILSCQDQVAISEITEVAKASTIALDLPREVQAKYNELKTAHPDRELLVVEVDANGQAKLESLKQKLDQLAEESILSVNVIKQPIQAGETAFERSFIIVEYDENIKAIQERSKSEDGVYTMVEKTSMPEGGMDKFYAFIGENLVYPKDAREKGVQGKVFVSFIVEVDGSLSNVSIEKGVNPSIDSAALQVITQSPKWVPGKNNGVAVRQKMVLPINFSIEKKGVNRVGFLMTPLNPFPVPGKNGKDKC